MADREDWPRGAFGGTATAQRAIDLENVATSREMIAEVASLMDGVRVDAGGELIDVGALIRHQAEARAFGDDRAAAWKSGYMIGSRSTDRAERDAAYERYRADFPVRTHAAPTDNTALIAELDAAKAENRVLVEAAREANALLAERTHGSPARSPAHNARLVLEAALTSRESASPAQQDACPRPDCPSGDGLICPDCAQRKGGA